MTIAVIIVLLMIIAVMTYFVVLASKNYHTIEEANSYSEKKHIEADEYFLTKKKDADAIGLRTAELKRGHSTLEKEISEMHKKIDPLSAEAEALEKTVSNLKSEKTSLLEELNSLHSQFDPEIEKAFIKAISIDAYEGLKSDEVKNQLAILRTKQNDSVKSGEALIVTNEGSKNIVESQKKQILRCFNSECVNIIENVTVKNMDASRTKIMRSYETINKIFTSDGVQITQEYLASKLEELSLVYAYMVKQDEEKEQRKAIREQMVEEDKVRREIEKEKQKIDKEVTQFTNQVNKLMAYMQKAKDEVERAMYIDKISELEEKLKALEADKKNVLQREQNTRAGFVYIISNIGSFGEAVFKIGMTRRLEPMDRIAELSSASVPFPFDVHAMIFSEDAPGLESILHQYFNDKRVNLVNTHKEFFRVDLDEIKTVVLENHNATVQFVDIPDAEQYRETLRLREASEVAPA